ncbi:MAG: thioredoxin-dependent thiol peroxidase [Planktomarina sp.]
MLNIGDKAPDFTQPGSGDGTITLSDYAGSNVVVYFYPKDDTPGCTTEALDFTAQLAAFAASNTHIIGISKDTAAKHDKFIAKHDLGIALASDADGTVCEDYGTWVEKKMYGKTFMGIERATFLIDASGHISQIWRKVKVKGHVDAVLGAAQELAK